MDSNLVLANGGDKQPDHQHQELATVIPNQPCEIPIVLHQLRLITLQLQVIPILFSQRQASKRPPKHIPNGAIPHPTIPKIHDKNSNLVNCPADGLVDIVL
ncbi:hypothetical protein NE237_006018 [Protea cynaroides]|uniref:Uncharacterized protein n=1 Tax=Protea cynaroides TaxID=273540 RepID=A0A9Q0KLT0_9MAGN|nr:hypothetical protein NE237_006018 [Protea cynaroides]